MSTLTPDRLKPLALKVAYAMPDLDSTDQRIVVGLYRQLAEGKPVAQDDLARRLDLPADRVRERLGSWPGVYLDDEQRVIGFWGLALQKMPHGFKVDGRQLYTWCAWDALFIPEILGKTAEVESISPVTGDTVSLTVSPSGVERCSPAGARVSFLSPDIPFDTDVIMTFCHYVLFFSSEEAGDRWRADHENTFLLTVDEAFEIGRLVNAANFGANFAKVA